MEANIRTDQQNDQPGTGHSRGFKAHDRNNTFVVALVRAGTGACPYGGRR